MRIPVIAIVGRPNVGKSTLFNSLVGERRAIVEDIPGVTRDRNYALVDRYAFPFSLVDTGGFEQTINGVIETQIREQAQLAVEEADALMIIFDGKTGLQPADEEVVGLVRKYQKPAIYCVNKCDGIEQKQRTYDFFSLGVGELYDISALHKRNLGSLMDAVLNLLPDCAELSEHHRLVRETQANAVVSAEEVDEDEVDYVQDEEPWEPVELSLEEKKEILKEQRAPSFADVFIPETGRDAESYDRANRLAEIVYLPEQASDVWEAEDGALAVTGPETLELVRVAIIGKPNVGKSTLLNTLIGETRAITSPIAGTTRDSLDIQFEYEEQNYLLTDTAGLRKKARISDEIERYSTLRSLRAISDADVAVLLIDASEGPTDQDAKIAALAHDQG
jgi:GTP-binding protein